MVFHDATCYTNSLLILQTSLISRALWLPRHDIREVGVYLVYTLICNNPPLALCLTTEVNDIKRLDHLLCAWNRYTQFKPPSLLSHSPLICHGFWHKNNPPKNWDHTLAHIMLSSLASLPFIAMLTLWYSVMPHVTLILW